MSEIQAAAGLMQAIAPIARRRPVHIIVSDAAGDANAPEGALRVVIQPVRVDDKEDPEVAKGFYVATTPEELDADLPRLLAAQWVPARVGLQSLLDQVRSAAEQTRQTTVSKAKEAKGGRKAGDKAGSGGSTGAQTAILTPGAGAASAAAPPVPTPSAAAAAPTQVAPEAAPAGDAATEGSPVAGAEPDARLDTDEPTPVAVPAASAPALAAAAASSDTVSDLFD